MSEQKNMERTVLGTILLDKPAASLLVEMRPEDFSLDSHRKLFCRLRTMHEASETLNIATLCHDLERLGHLEAVGGRNYVFYLTEDIPRNYDISAYVKRLRTSANHRRLDHMCELVKTRLATGEKLEDVVPFIQEEILEVQRSHAGEERPQLIRHWVDSTLEELRAERFRKPGTLVGIASGIAPLDEATTGWRNGELTYVGAIPARGKTSFLLQSLHQASSVDGIFSGIISLEMRREKLMRRLTVMHGNQTSAKMRDPALMSEQEWAETESTIRDHVGELPVVGTDVSNLNPGKISLCARQMYDMGARILFVDFVQIIQEDDRDRRAAIMRVSASLRDTCKQLNIPFVVASQLSRRDNDINRRPTMQDLRESGNLEQDAHRVLLLYRPEQNNEFTGEDEILIAKQREGCMGHIDVRYNENKFRFEAR